MSFVPILKERMTSLCAVVVGRDHGKDVRHRTLCLQEDLCGYGLYEISYCFDATVQWCTEHCFFLPYWNVHTPVNISCYVHMLSSCSFISRGTSYNNNGFCVKKCKMPCYGSLGTFSNKTIGLAVIILIKRD